MRAWRLTAVLAFLGAPFGGASGDPLFESDETLKITIRGPLDALMDDRENEVERPGQLLYTDADGTEHTLDIQLRVRGNFRRDARYCEFTPLRVNLKKSQLDDTVFDKQDKLKLVTHCMTRDASYAHRPVLEYLAYRIYNTVTDLSFRARLVEVTYEETEKNRSPFTEFGIFIEHDDRLGKRIGLEPVDGIDRVSLDRVNAEQVALDAVFQYLIGNTDFSPVSSADPDSCCHNHTLFGGPEGEYVSIPYDFDQSGIVDAPYAMPNSRFRIDDVKERVFRGRCRHNDLLDASLDRFRDRRDTIVALVNKLPELSNYSRSVTLRYIEAFYKEIARPRNVERRLRRKCI
jgi:hypothetical protein